VIKELGMEKYKKIAVDNFGAINRAAKIHGTKKSLATRIGVSKQVINFWMSHDTPLPYDKVLAIYAATEGKVSVDDFRSDCKGVLDDAVAIYIATELGEITDKLPSDFQGIMKELKIMLLKKLNK
jgi:DNA-binding transcriptional regulator YdaS (Cro superfamily)